MSSYTGNIDGLLSNDSTDHNNGGTSPALGFPPLPISGTNVFEATTEPRDDESLLEKLKRIEQMDTNFIFLFGKPATGKSYITASLIYYLNSSIYGKLRLAPNNTYESRLLYEDMLRNFSKGKLIDRTTQRENAVPYEIHLEFQPNDERKPVMKITFLEMSGEDLNKVQLNRKDSSSGKLPDNIDAYLNCDATKLIFFLVAQHQTASEDSRAIDIFLNYINQKSDNSKKAHCLLAVTKWDTYAGTDPDAIETFAQKEMAGVYAKLTNKECSNAITHYSIGKMVPGTTDQILKIESQRAEEVTKWLYFKVTGEHLVPEPSTWQKILHFFQL